MSHQVYTTECIILKRTPFRESDVFLEILTKDLGFIRASASGVRTIHSKLRPNLQDFSTGTISLVRGKYEWKITNAETHGNFYNALSRNRECILLVARSFSLVRMLCQGEERNIELFALLRSSLEFLTKGFPGGKLLKNFEAILILRILRNLGYLGNSLSIEDFVRDTEWNESLLSTMDNHYTQAISYINSSFEESQLVHTKK